MSFDQPAVTPIANIPDISGSELNSVAQVTDIDPSIPPTNVESPDVVDTMINSLEKTSGGVSFQSVEPPVQNVSTISSTEGIPQSVFHVGPEQAEVSVFDQAMANFQSATHHAIEVTIVSTAGTSMAGSMSKLMSGS